MGSCVSVHKDPETPMKKLRLVIGSKNNKLVNPSPVKHKSCTVNGVDSKVDDHPPKSQPSPSHPAPASFDFASKEETFFDTQVYLESDCEDDFYSVKGDFTPSRGNTPTHQSFSTASPKVPMERAPISVPQTSPTDKKKKRLSELFKESLGGEQELNSLDAVKERNGGGTPYSSACSNATPSQELKHVTKSAKPGQCCFPRLRSRRSFSDSINITSPAG